jgi:hypothetical protein
MGDHYCPSILQYPYYLSVLPRCVMVLTKTYSYNSLKATPKEHVNLPKNRYWKNPFFCPNSFFKTSQKNTTHVMYIFVSTVFSPIHLEPLHVHRCKDKNGFRIFRYSGNRFRNFSVGFIGNGIFSKTESVLEIFYRNRRGVLPIVSFGYRFLSKITGFVSRNFPELCLRIFRNCVSEFFRIVSRNFSEISSM